jgi:hypothetical protein
MERSEIGNGRGIAGNTVVSSSGCCHETRYRPNLHAPQVGLFIAVPGHRALQSLVTRPPRASSRAGESWLKPQHSKPGPGRARQAGLTESAVEPAHSITLRGWVCSFNKIPKAMDLRRWQVAVLLLVAGKHRPLLGRDRRI